MYLKVQSSFVLFYFKEERQSLRQLLVEIFACLCGLKKEILSQLLCSVLPSELAMEIMKRKEGNKNSGHHNFDWYPKKVHIVVPALSNFLTPESG